ncbi:helix-turn-helix transcriptional regulator [Paenibacillus sp. LjRoot153]|uniref:helix-turn-helix domain-containing protein n=1 Tax=Paenibacillus sp. LjRoot153 TaxID=3342270 RepID=UPI003ECD7BBF
MRVLNTTNIRILFGKRVRAIRSSMGVSQEEFAFLCGLHRTYISDIERGTRNVSLENVERIAHALKVTPKDLFDFQSLELDSHDNDSV